MASNGLVANPNKPVFVDLNEKRKDEFSEFKLKKIQVGRTEISQSKSCC